MRQSLGAQGTHPCGSGHPCSWPSCTPQHQVKSQGARGQILCHHHCSSLVAAAVQWELAFVCTTQLPRAPVGASAARAGLCVHTSGCCVLSLLLSGRVFLPPLPCCVPQLLSHSMGAVPVGHSQRTEWNWFISYILLLPASKGAPHADPLECFSCRTLFLLQGEEGGCRTEVLQAGVYFLVRNLQSAIASCVQPSARHVCSPPEPWAACYSLCLGTKLCRGCT